jgi:hypothetical protein
VQAEANDLQAYFGKIGDRVPERLSAECGKLQTRAEQMPPVWTPSC